MSKPWADSRSEYVGRMFGAIADHYDLMNRIMTLGRDIRWRQQAADVARIGPGSEVLDVATGTGDLAFELAARVRPSGLVVGIDFAMAMLRQAERKAAGRDLPVTFMTGDALQLPFEANTFDAATCAFGLRNVDNRQRALHEMTRVTRDGGRVVILELTPPRNTLTRHYMDDVVPRLGQILARAREAYTYLPQSVQEFPGPPELGHMMQSAGLEHVTYRLLNFGTVALHWGTKPPK
jgi:demethylmenaquinone methyltransferase/2-methoxy-6-polyprenyl-1,4-benzoquinol methylase